MPKKNLGGHHLRECVAIASSSGEGSIRVCEGFSVYLLYPARSELSDILYFSSITRVGATPTNRRRKTAARKAPPNSLEKR